MKLHRPWHIFCIISSSVHQNKNLIIILASGKIWYLKTLNLVFQNGNVYKLFASHICYGKKMQCFFFFYHHLKYVFLKAGCNKTSTETCIWTLWIFKAKIDNKRQKLACLLGGILFPMTWYTQQCLHCKKQYIEMTQCYLTYMNPATNFSFTKSSSWNLSLLWNIDTCVCTCKANT